MTDNPTNLGNYMTADTVGVPVALRDQLQFALWSLEDQLDAGSPTVSMISTVAQAHRVVAAVIA